MTDDDALRKILTTAGEARLARRGAALLRQCATQGDTPQVLYESVFECLGYACNRVPFRQLAQAVPLARIQEAGPADECAIGALLLGTAGMLPDPTTCRILTELKEWLGHAWHYWWQRGLPSLPLVWDNSGTRPLNCVLRRLVAGLYWLRLCQGNPEKWLQDRLHAANSPRELLRSLTRPLPENPIWRKCHSFDRRTPQEAALLGPQRLLDIAVNVYLPFLYANAEVQEDAARLALIREAYLAIPRTPPNQLLRNACHRFLSPPSREHDLLKKTAQQQGMMDIFKNFCLALNHDCNGCPFVTGQPPPM